MFAIIAGGTAGASSPRACASAMRSPSRARNERSTASRTFAAASPGNISSFTKIRASAWRGS